MAAHPAESAPTAQPIGLQISRTAKTISRAFDRAMAAAGGSQHRWLILLELKVRPPSTQRELAQSLAIQEATLTHHLDGMERDGLLTRGRDPDNRRVHRLALTPSGEAVFDQLRDAALAHDQRLRTNIDPDDLAVARRVLDQLIRNVTDPTG